MNLDSAIRIFLDSIALRLSPHTVRAYHGDLADWGDDLRSREIISVNELSNGLKRGDVRSYVDRLQGEMAKGSVSRRVYAIIGFLKFARSRDWIEKDIWTLFPAVRVPKSLPDVLSVSEAFALVHQPDPSTLLGARDRALIEVLYGSGLRVQEAVGINFEDLKDGFVEITGKGGKVRQTPLTSNALRAIEVYRAALAIPPTGPLFRNYRGDRIDVRSVGRTLKTYMHQISPGRRIYPHLLRHSCASHMMSAGADLATIRELLGHANLSTSQKYLSVDLPHLRGDYMDAHPIAQEGLGSRLTEGTI